MEDFKQWLQEIFESIVKLQTKLSGFEGDSQIQPFLDSLKALKATIKDFDPESANILMVSQVFSNLNSYITDYLQKVPKEFTRRRREELLILHNKLKILTSFVTTASQKPLDDLFSLPKSHNRWKALQGYVSIQPLRNPKLEKSYSQFMLKVATGQALIHTLYKGNSSFKRRFMPAFYGLYFQLFTKEALHTAKLFQANPDVPSAITLWNLLESSISKKMFLLVIPRIKLNRILKIPRSFPHVLERPGCETPVSIRALSHIDLIPKNLTEQDSFIFHIHGGGFVAMSSASHQCYTRKWVRSLEIPCFSVDYRLAPEHQFPCGLDDVWQAYNYLLQNAEAEFGITPKRIYLAGDSAGGNLALALTFRLIETGIQLPDALILAYPALTLIDDYYSPSALLTLEDNLVPYNFLKICGECYVGPSEDKRDKYISPLLCDDGVLSRLPPVRIVVGDQDPLADDCWRLAERLVSVGSDVKMKVFEGAPHGILNMCFKGGIRESNLLVDQLSEWIQEFR